MQQFERAPAERAPVERGLTKIGELGELSSPQAKLVVLYVGATGRTTVDELHETLSIRRIDLLSTLPGLVDRGLLVREGDCYHVA